MKNKNHLNGYHAKNPLPAFVLPSNARVLPVPYMHRLSLSYERKIGHGFELLRDAQGRPVVKDYPDLAPGEVNLVLR